MQYFVIRIKRLIDWTERHFCPMVPTKCRITADGPYFSIGCGVKAEYGVLGAGVMVNGILPLRETDLTVFIMVRI